MGSLEIPYNYLDKVFLSHLHTDHFGDFAALFIGGWVSGRDIPLRVWGPSGDTSELGTKYALEHWEKALNWDITGRRGRIPANGGVLEINEFDYKQNNGIIYQENGVTIRSWPAVHVIDGAVSYSLEWNGLKFVFGGDTSPNKWYVENAKNADLAIHESFITVLQLIDKFKFNPQTAIVVGTSVHTPPAAFGKIMSMVKPRMAIAYHFFNDFDTRYDINDEIRSTYDGPLTLATDLLVWNVTKDKITVREVIVDPAVWPPQSPGKPAPPDPKLRIDPSEYILDGELDMADVIEPIIEQVDREYGINDK